MRTHPTTTLVLVLSTSLAIFAGLALVPDALATSVDCRKGRKIVVREGSCKSREQAVMHRLGLVRLPGGQSRVLLQAGQLTLTGVCAINDMLGEDVAVVYISTTQSGAAFDAFRESSNLTVAMPEAEREFARVATTTTTPVIENQEAIAIAPDGTVLSGELLVGVNVLNSVGECVFGGHLVQ